MSLFWKIVDRLDSDPTRAQIVVGLTQDESPQGRIDRLGELLAQRLAGCLGPGEDAEAVVVIATDSQSCQEAVVKLGELGVKQLHAIHPKRSTARDQAAPQGRVPRDGA